MNNQNLSEIHVMDIESEAPAMQEKNRIPFIRLALLFVIVPINMIGALLSYEAPKGVSAAYLEGSFYGYLAAPISVPIIIVLIFQIGCRYRNWGSQIKIFFWVSIFFFLGALGNISSAILATQA